jgi:hypothetical protein
VGWRDGAGGRREGGREWDGGREGESGREGEMEVAGGREGGGSSGEIPLKSLATLHLVTPQGTFFYGRFPDRRSFPGRLCHIHSIFDLKLQLHLESVWGGSVLKSTKSKVNLYRLQWRIQDNIADLLLQKN